MFKCQSRKKAWQLCKSLGLPVNLNLPALDEGLALRHKTEIANRTLTLFACVSVSYGFPRESSKKWLASQGLLECLSKDEKEFLNHGNSAEEFKLQVEAIYIFSWLLGFKNEIFWRRYVPNDLVTIFPDIKNQESANRFIETSKIQTFEKVTQALDTAYCLDWAVTESLQRGKENPLPYCVKARRKPLEWVLSSEGWDEAFLDT